MGVFLGHAKLMVSLLQDKQANDQRSTMLQLVDKMKIKQKELGWFVLCSIYALYVARYIFYKVLRALGLISLLGEKL